MDTVFDLMENIVRQEQSKLMDEFLEYCTSCRYCNKRRCRYRSSLPKKISKKELREAFLNSLQLDLFP